jgi:hypothetical protein
LLPFSPEPSVFPSVVKKSKNENIQAIILPVILYGCETCSPTLKEEDSLRVFENKVLRKIFGPKGDEATGEWRKLHNNELRDSRSIIIIIKSRRMRWTGHVVRMGEERNMCGILVGKPEGKRPLGRPGRSWTDNIKMDILEIGWGGVDWIGLAQDRDKWRPLLNAGKLSNGYIIGGPSSSSQFHRVS